MEPPPQEVKENAPAEISNEEPNIPETETSTLIGRPKFQPLQPEQKLQLEKLPGYNFRKDIAKYWNKIGESRWLSEAEWEYRNACDNKGEGWVLDFDYTDDRCGNEVQSITINSSYLMETIRKAIKFDGAIDKLSSSLEFDAPFCAFFHHWEDIEATVKTDTNASETEKHEFEVLKWAYNNRQLENDSKLTFKLLHDQISEAIKVGSINYENIWALYRPGERLLIKDALGEWQMAMCVSCRKTIPRDPLMKGIKRPTKWEVVLWQITWNAAEECFSRVLWIYELKPFVGSRRITAIPLLPLKYYQDEDNKVPNSEAQQQLENFLIKRGLSWKNYTSNNPASAFYDGPAVVPNFLDGQSPSRSRSYERPQTSSKIIKASRIIIDQSGDYSSSDMMNVKSEDSISPGDVSAWDDRKEFIAFDSHPRKLDFEATGIQAMMCPGALLCHHAESAKWYWVSINKLQEVSWRTDALDCLVLHPDKKQTLVDIVENHQKGKSDGVPDLISGKGEGLVILLYGPPGVGKTLTAEGVAEHLQRPLKSISFSSLIDTQGDFESYLKYTFQQASRHGAILVLDEADVILEQRAFEDVKRNSIVSTFLRTIEYFDGIVFLTTNRPKTIDPAFESRIHHTIEYEPLNSVTRMEIWKQFLTKLEPRSEANIARVMDSLDHFKYYELNGRQIRNVINISSAIARARTNGVLDIEVVKAIAKKTSTSTIFKGATNHDEYNTEDRSDWYPKAGPFNGFR
ncbi:hypothetical protein BP6252_13354 [Coleophoma cylindrospora]|uniref:AAA+ ATPase domain-containing protein n=1 Tax=Coleophoma cylindrospora TaxID=1849047 RepID=A0A3D8QB97_9HELO|nr:hypothetical protein BP6252_13354 [Coleophoma cylindrospora]